MGAAWPAGDAGAACESSLLRRRLIAVARSAGVRVAISVMMSVMTTHAPDRRTEILAAAQRVILRDGIDGIRSQAIASEAGVSVALPHYYYPTLDDLARAVWDQVDAAERAREDAMLAGTAAPISSLRAFVVGAFAGPVEQVRERWMLHTEFQRRAIFDAGLAEVVRAADQRRLAALATIITAAQAEGDVPAGADRDVVAARIAGAMDGFGVMLLVGLVSPTVASADLERLLARRGGWGAAHRHRHADVPVAPAVGGEDRRTKVLDATIDLVAREGIAGVHFPEVADAAGVSRSLPRYYYRTLNELLRAAFARDEEVARQRVEWRASHIDDPLARLRDAYSHSLAADPVGVRATWVLWFEYLRLAARDPAERRRASGRLAAWIAYDSTLLRELRHTGRIAETIDIDAAEQHLLAVHNGAGALWALGVLPLERYIEVVDATIDDELGLT
jgi:AcrR family transcriptional regulator